MKVILHLGAHRCATTSFQQYLRQNSDRLLQDHRLGFWGPNYTRQGLFHGIQPVPGTRDMAAAAKRARGRLKLHMHSWGQQGAEQLLISDENLIGSMRQNLRLGDLYCGVGERLARLHDAFDGQLSEVAINLRSLENYWTSVMTFAVARGHRLPNAGHITRLVDSPRSWRDVLTDMAASLPDVTIRVLPYETYGSRPEAQLEQITAVPGPREHARVRLNRSLCLDELRQIMPSTKAQSLPEGNGRWRFFDNAQKATLRERYADDLMWLAAGAGGLTQIQYDPEKTEAGFSLLHPDLTRGRSHDKQDRRLAGIS